MHERRAFDHGAATSKVGRQIRTLVDFSGVPRGTTGVVTRADPAADGYTVAVEWELPDRTRPLVDWFTQDEYERFLVEI